MSSDNLTDSPDGPICSICYNKLSDSPYAKIDDPGEVGKFHIQCLEQWMQKSDRGIIVDKKITSYSVYHEDQLIETRINNTTRKNDQQNITIDENNMLDTTQLIADYYEDDSGSDNEYLCHNGFTCGQLVCVGFALIIILIFILVSYLLNHK